MIETISLLEDILSVSKRSTFGGCEYFGLLQKHPILNLRAFNKRHAAIRVQIEWGIGYEEAISTLS
jgi:hypothetical protein